MWFLLALFATFMLVIRRTAEKEVSVSVDSQAMAWLQQAMALPFIIITLFFARFYQPSQLSAHFWLTMTVYVICCAVDLLCYFKALSLADISFVAPLLALTSVGNTIGSYFVLGQKPSTFGIVGIGLIVSGAYLVNKAKAKDHAATKSNKKALIYILALVVIRGYYSNIEVPMLRATNPTTFNFYSSLLTVPSILIISYLIRGKSRLTRSVYWQDVRSSIKKYFWPLAFIGLTYTINLTSTYQAKILSPVAGYVGTVKAAQVVPMMLIGIFFFKEKVVKLQWVGIAMIIFGLVALATN